MFWMPVECFHNFLRAQDMEQVIEGKIIYKWSEGKQKTSSS